MKFEPRYVETNPNAPAENHLRDFFRLSLWIIYIFFGLYLILGYAAEKIAEHLPPEVEKKIGGMFIAKVDTETFPRNRLYVQRVLDRLVAADNSLPPFTYTVSIVDSETVNAVALPAGNIVVMTGLLEKVKNENELAMILGHELGHYVHRDQLRGLGRGLVLVTLGGIMGISGDLPGFVMPSLQTFELRFSRQQEAAADQFGVELVNEAYGHASGVLGVFDILHEADSKEPKRPGFFSTHPDSISRKQTITEFIKTKKYLQNEELAPIPEPGVLPLKEDAGIMESDEYRIEGKMVRGRYDGYIKWYRKTDGSLHTEGEYHNGLENGIFKKYSPQGTLTNEWGMQNGEYEGGSVNYYDDGQLESRYFYMSGKCIGEYYSPQYIQKAPSKDKKLLVLRNSSGQELFAMIWLNDQGNLKSMSFYSLEVPSDGKHPFALKTKEGEPIKVTLHAGHGVFVQYIVDTSFRPADDDWQKPTVLTVVSDEGEEIAFTFHWSPDHRIKSVDLKPASLGPAHIVK